MKPSSKFALILGLFGSAALTLQADEAHAYDMDCKVILCIAGGFPASCGDAYSYMIKRITRFPKPLPPFGFCAMSDGSEYKAHDVNYRYLHRGPDAYDCPQGKKLYYRRDDDDRGGWGNETAFCYTHTTTQQTGWGEDRQWQTIYHGQSAAARVNFELKITIEPGTQHEFKSPLFRINWGTGYVSQRPI
ncbi:MAG: hypothetical protein AAF412_02010 [Pseudomonadota bacterium]